MNRMPPFRPTLRPSLDPSLTLGQGFQRVTLEHQSLGSDGGLFKSLGFGGPTGASLIRPTIRLAVLPTIKEKTFLHPKILIAI